MGASKTKLFRDLSHGFPRATRTGSIRILRGGRVGAESADVTARIVAGCFVVSVPEPELWTSCGSCARQRHVTPRCSPSCLKRFVVEPCQPADRRLIRAAAAPGEKDLLVERAS